MLDSSQERIPAHTDITFMTLLWSQKPGLEIQLNNEWHSNLCKPGHLIINLGKALALMTNNRCRAINHRVILPNNTARTAVASFFSPDPNSSFINLITGETITDTFAQYAEQHVRAAYPKRPDIERWLRSSDPACQACLLPFISTKTTQLYILLLCHFITIASLSPFGFRVEICS